MREKQRSGWALAESAPLDEYVLVARLSGMMNQRWEYLTARLETSSPGFKTRTVWRDAQGDSLSDGGEQPLWWRPLPESPPEVRHRDLVGAELLATFEDQKLVEEHERGGPLRGVQLILAERVKQLERYDAEHDDGHDAFQLTRHAVACALEAGGLLPGIAPSLDSWELVVKHSDDREKLLSIAGALIAAEIDRLSRERAPGPRRFTVGPGGDFSTVTEAVASGALRAGTSLEILEDGE